MAGLMRAAPVESCGPVAQRLLCSVEVGTQLPKKWKLVGRSGLRVTGCKLFSGTECLFHELLWGQTLSSLFQNCSIGFQSNPCRAKCLDLSFSSSSHHLHLFFLLRHLLTVLSGGRLPHLISLPVTRDHVVNSLLLLPAYRDGCPEDADSESNLDFSFTHLYEVPWLLVL